MQPGTLIQSDVQAFTSRVLVNGVQRPVLSWSVSRELVGDLPDQVVAGGGVKQATGNIEWASSLDVSAMGANPWNPSTGWIPSEGDVVQIFAGDGTTEWSQFVGAIDQTSGSIGGGIESSIIDRIDQLSQPINIPALITAMPPLVAGDARRRVGLSTQFHINTAMRMSGFYTTPKPEFGCVLDAPLIGSCWPLVGDVKICARQSDPFRGPAANGATWGASRSDMSAEYVPVTSRPGTVPVQLTLVRTSEHAGTAFLKAIYGTSHAVELRLTPTRATARIDEIEVASIGVSGDAVVQLLLKGGAVTVRSGEETATVPIAWAVSDTLERIRVEANIESRIAGVQVSHPTATRYEFASLAHVMTAQIRMGSFLNAGHQALPGVTDQAASEVLDEISRATLRPFWIDENGVARCIASDNLYGGSSVQTVTTLDDIRTLDWAKDLLGVRSQVIAKYQKPVISARSVPSVTVWEASDSVVLKSGEVYETVIEPPAGEDWVLVDEKPRHIGGVGLTEVNAGEESFYGGIVTDGVDEMYATPNLPGQDWLNASFRVLGTNKYLARFEARTLPAGRQLEIRTFSPTFTGNVGLWPYWWGKSLPMIRAKARVQWTELIRTPSIAGTIGPVLEMDMGPWATGGETTETTAVDAIASFVAEQVTSPKPVITSMRVGFDPRRQLGDVITVQSDTLMGVSLKCLITGITNAAGASYEQNLSVRIIDVTSTFTTWAQFAEAWGNTANYDSLTTAWDAISTYSDFNNDPLRGTL